MPAHIWTNAQRKAQGIRMKKLNAKKKYNLNQKKFDFKPAQNMVEAPDVAMQPVEDVHRNYEYHYRRGLVTAMECILRELR